VSEDLIRRVKEALERTDIMALSTIGPDGPWTAPVQFHYNERLELFFLSMPDTRHVRNICVSSAGRAWRPAMSAEGEVVGLDAR
jgi:hypothetical protein